MDHTFVIATFQSFTFCALPTTHMFVDPRNRYINVNDEARSEP